MKHLNHITVISKLNSFKVNVRIESRTKDQLLNFKMYLAKRHFPDGVVSASAIQKDHTFVESQIFFFDIRVEPSSLGEAKFLISLIDYELENFFTAGKKDESIPHSVMFRGQAWGC